MFMYLSVVIDQRHLFIVLAVDWIKELYIRNAVWINLTVHVFEKIEFNTVYYKQSDVCLLYCLCI